jgi:hypothetical protein
MDRVRAMLTPHSSLSAQFARAFHAGAQLQETYLRHGQVGSAVSSLTTAIHYSVLVHAESCSSPS